MNASQIVCVSANPAIDRRLRCHSLALGAINRAITVTPTPGGKAAHVAMAAHAMGAATLWLGFLGGAAGKDFLEKFRGLGIRLAAVQTTQSTRMNLELLEDSGRVTEILEPGPTLTGSELNEIRQVLKRTLSQSNRPIVVISGSLPQAVPPSFYQRLIAIAKGCGSRLFLDTSGEALRKSLEAAPDLVKPNREEVQNLLGRRLPSEKALIEAAGELIRRGAKSAAISLGAEGLIWLQSREGPAWHARPPRVKAISTVGCGDSTVAGFALAGANGLNGEAAVRLATACGTANCLADSPGRISPKQVKLLIPLIKIRRIH